MIDNEYQADEMLPILDFTDTGGPKWHFTTSDNRAKVHTVSEVIDRLLKEDSKFSFMEWNNVPYDFLVSDILLMMILVFDMKENIPHL